VRLTSIREGVDRMTTARVFENLAGMWLADMSAKGMNATQAIKLLNSATGRSYSYKRAWEWKSGKREVPAVARRAMLRMSLRYVLRCFGVSIQDDALQELASLIS
jgi:hypothetical protein